MQHIAILTGGQSSERDIALRSAKNVQSVLSDRYVVEVFDVPADLPKFLNHYQRFDAVIPMLHGTGGEDGVIQGFLETLGVPYIFSGVQAHAIAMDKDKTKTIVAAAGIRVPRSVMTRDRLGTRYSRPVVVKPYNGGSSVATAVARSQEELDIALAKAFEYTSAVLIEDFVQGDEFTVAVADIDSETIGLPVIAICPKDGFFDFESKYNVATLADEICPAPISDDLTKQLQFIALTAHRVLGCRHVSRTDIIVDGDGNGWFLETNTIPGMTKTSLLPKALHAAGYDFAAVLTSWINDVSRK